MNFLIPNQRAYNHWFSDFDRLFETFESEKSLNVAADIEESENHVLISIDVPGMKEGDFSVKVEDNHLVIRGERKREETKSEKSQIVLSRRIFGQFQKVYALPETIDAQKIEADYRDGVLRIYLPKTVVQKENAIEVKVKGQDSFFDRLLGSAK